MEARETSFGAITKSLQDVFLGSDAVNDDFHPC